MLVQDTYLIADKFKRTFGIPLTEFIDKEVALAHFYVNPQEYNVVINVVKFEDWLHRHFDEYDEDMSMAEFLEKRWGADVRRMIEKLL